ncbi:MAG: hypothetical protein U0790_06200 [Isosphaeraceae bacterium]
MSDRPAGQVWIILLIAVGLGILAVGASALWVARHAGTPVEANLGPWALRETHREVTGQQRASRLAFVDRGRALAVMCPRYNKVLLYRVTAADTLEVGAEIALEGRPVAIAAAGDRVIALQRPPGDDKHLGTGWWQAFSLDGRPAGGRVASGFYPDDCAASPDGRHLYVLSSGRAEGDARKPAPALEVFSLDGHDTGPTLLGRLEFDPEDDLDRLALSASGTRALAVLRRGGRALAIDVAEPEAPRLVGPVALNPTEAPHASLSDDGDWIVMPPSPEAEAVGLPAPATRPGVSPGGGVGYIAYLRPDDSALEIVQASPRLPVGQFPIRGPFNLGGTRPSGLAACPGRGLLAVATKPGTVHLIAIQSRLVQISGPPGNRLLR